MVKPLSILLGFNDRHEFPCSNSLQITERVTMDMFARARPALLMITYTICFGLRFSYNMRSHRGYVVSVTFPCPLYFTGHPCKKNWNPSPPLSPVKFPAQMFVRVLLVIRFIRFHAKSDLVRICVLPFRVWHQNVFQRNSPQRTRCRTKRPDS